MLLAALAALFVYQVWLGDDLEAFLYRWGLVAAAVAGSVRGDPDQESAVLVTLVTTLFLHAGWLHLVFNGLYLAVFGRAVESALGHARTLALFVVAGVGGSVVHVLVQPESVVPAIGASGAISGLIAAHLTLFPGATLASLAPVVFFSSAANVPAMLLLIVWLVAQALSGLASITEAGNVAWWAHLGGFACGILLAPILRPRRRPRW